MNARTRIPELLSVEDACTLRHALAQYRSPLQNPQLTQAGELRELTRRLEALAAKLSGAHIFIQKYSDFPIGNSEESPHA